MKQYFTSRYILITIIYIILHIAGAVLGNYVNMLANRMVYFWPPVGFSLALLLFFGYKYWPGIFIAGIIVALLTGASPTSALFFAAGNTIGPLVTVYILKNILHFNNKIEKVRDVVGLVFFALPISSAVLATVITTARMINHTVTSLMYGYAWMNLWVSDILNNIIVAIPTLLWLFNPTIKITTFKRALEAVALFVSFIFLGLFIFTNVFGISSPKTYLVFFPIIWAALRFGPRETATIVFVYCGLAVWSTNQHIGPFMVGNVIQDLIYLRSFMLIFAITSLMLAAAINQSRELERRKNSFIEIASHELKTPLTSLKIITQLLKRKSNQDKAYLDTMDQQIDKLTGITHTLLDLSRIQAEKFVLHKKYTNLQVVIDSAVKTITYAEKTHKIIVKNKVRNKVNIDRERIGQVLINLINNAVKHSPKADTVIVEVEKKGNLVQISVQDFGAGISKEKINRIFERFYQISEGKELEGLGLGLFISSEIIKQHEGKIWVKSEVGKGSTFYFTLPIKARG